MLKTMFRNALWGMYLLVFLIPQPNIWYKFHDYPFGKDFMDLLIVAILIGIILQKIELQKSSNTYLIIAHLTMVYISVWISSLSFSLPLPISTSSSLVIEYKNYVEMVLMYFLAFNLIRDEKQKKVLIIIMACVLLLIAIRIFRNFDVGGSFRWDKRAGGPFETVGLGANHMGAFFAQYAFIFLALFFIDKNKKRKLLFLSTALFSLYPIFYAYSRGAYLATTCVLLLYGWLKKRILLILLIILFVSWQTILPVSVVDRINMTVDESGEMENSAGGRLDLWGLAFELFEENPLIGIGFDGYAMSMGGVETSRGKTKEHQDVHSIFMRILCEQGIVGFIIFIGILFRAFRSGWLLFRSGEQTWESGLGLGFLGCVTGVAITNLFGDRWSYFVLGSYFWIFWGLVDRYLFDLKGAKQVS